LTERILHRFLKYLSLIIIFVFSSSGAFSQPYGELYDIGDTYNDIQHAGSVGRMAALGADYTVHFSWTGYLYPPEVLYNRYTTAGGVAFNFGDEVSNLNLSRYANIDVLGSNRSVLAYEGAYLGQSICAVAVENGPQSANFLEYYPPAEEPLTSPLLVVDNRRWIHILAFTSRYNWKYGLYYNRSEDNGFTWLTDWVFIDSVRVMTAGITSSSQGEVAIAWAHNLSDTYTNPLELLNNDLYLVKSVNGSDWNFTAPSNITDFNGGFHPDADSLRFYDDISMAYGNSNQLNIAYNCTGYWEEAGHTVTCAGAKLYNYSDADGIHYIAGELTSGSIPPGDRRTYDRPSLGYDPFSGDFFCVWTQYTEAGDTSSLGVLNSELYGAYFDNQAEIWSSSINLTETATPGALPGACQSELFPTITALLNDTLHISYLLDKNPGASGDYMSDIMYLKIPAEEFRNAVGVDNLPSVSLPVSAALLNNYPNPCNSSTMIILVLPQNSLASLTIYDLQGRIVESLWNGYLDSGEHSFSWNAENLASGIYFLGLSTERETISRKIVVLK